jgi:hypothetical protein
MKKTIIILGLAVILLSMPVYAKVSVRFGTTHANINGLNIILPDVAKISNHVGMIPVRLLTLESGHTIIVGQAKPQAELYSLVEPMTVQKGYDYFKTPCFVFDPSNKLTAIFGVDSDDLIINDNRSKLSAKTYVSEGVFFVPAREMCKILGLEMTKNGEDFDIVKPPPAPVKKHWTEKLIEAIPLEIIIYVCIGFIVFFTALFFVLTPLRRMRTNRG